MREATCVNGRVSDVMMIKSGPVEDGGMGPQDRDEGNSTRQSANLPGVRHQLWGEGVKWPGGSSLWSWPEREWGLVSDLFRWQGPRRPAEVGWL